MKTARKAIMAVLCVLCIIVATITGTLAYLTDSESVTNTFTVGDVQIKLDEAKVNTDGTPVEPAERTEEGNAYHLLPGMPYTKDPTVHILEGSEESYVRMVVKVKNVEDLKAAFAGKAEYFATLDDTATADDIALEKLLDNTWNYGKWHFNNYKEVSETTGEGADAVTVKYGVYEFRYVDKVTGPAKDNDDATVAQNDLEPLFTKILIPGADIDNDHLANLASVEVIVEAHAIQSAGFNDADAAWAAFDAQHPNT